MRPDRMFEIWSCTRIKERFRLPSSFFLLTVPKQFFCRFSISLAFMVSYVVFLFIYFCLFFGFFLCVFFFFFFFFVLFVFIVPHLFFFWCLGRLFPLLVPWEAAFSFSALERLLPFLVPWEAVSSFGALGGYFLF